MKLSFKDLNNLRSGQTVYRVWGWAKEDGSVYLETRAVMVIGKKTRHKICEGHYPFRMVWARLERIPHKNRPLWTYGGVAEFLNDLQGLGCWTKRSQAERFVREVHAGLHPELVNQLQDWLADDLMFHRSYDDHTPTDEGEFEDIPF